jgi:hypothetical protein
MSTGEPRTALPGCSSGAHRADERRANSIGAVCSRGAPKAEESKCSPALGQHGCSSQVLGQPGKSKTMGPAQRMNWSELASCCCAVPGAQQGELARPEQSRAAGGACSKLRTQEAMVLRGSGAAGAGRSQCDGPGRPAGAGSSSTSVRLPELARDAVAAAIKAGPTRPAPAWPRRALRHQPPARTTQAGAGLVGCSSPLAGEGERLARPAGTDNVAPAGVVVPRLIFDSSMQGHLGPPRGEHRSAVGFDLGGGEVPPTQQISDEQRATGAGEEVERGHPVEIAAAIGGRRTRAGTRRGRRWVPARSE